MTHQPISIQHETGPPWPTDVDRNVELWELSRIITMALELGFRPAIDELDRRARLGSKEALAARGLRKDNNNETGLSF